MRLRVKNLPRPNVDRESPDLRINVWLNKENRQHCADPAVMACTCAGYRDRTGLAPLKRRWRQRLLRVPGCKP